MLYIKICCRQVGIADGSYDSQVFWPYAPDLAYCEATLNECRAKYGWTKQLPCEGKSPCINLCYEPHQMVTRFNESYPSRISSHVRNDLLDNYDRYLEGKYVTTHQKIENNI